MIRRHRFDPPEEGEKFVMERLPEPFWTAIEERWAGDDARRWQLLGMLHLSQHCRWTTRMLSATFVMSPGHVARLLAKVRAELRIAAAETSTGSEAGSDRFNASL